MRQCTQSAADLLQFRRIDSKRNETNFKARPKQPLRPSGTSPALQERQAQVSTFRQNPLNTWVFRLFGGFQHEVRQEPRLGRLELGR
ncbi:MAG: hypothetical protein EAZ43_14390 [Betaproteobacteria bacterium]|nr:MAG: hypothetical protein EAZ43_14390 [Betaproteobacteria bacterium]